MPCWHWLPAGPRKLRNMLRTYRPTAEAPDPTFASTKEHPEAHGFGIPIMRSIVEKYDGAVTLSVSDGWFTADAMLYMEGA